MNNAPIKHQTHLTRTGEKNYKLIKFSNQVAWETRWKWIEVTVALGIIIRNGALENCSYQF